MQNVSNILIHINKIVQIEWKEQMVCQPYDDDNKRKKGRNNSYVFIEKK